MKKNWRMFLLLGILILLLAGVFVMDRFSKKIPKNPAGTLGNTAGNLNNNGYFCEDNGVVYFANSYDNNALYSMNSDESKMKKLISAKISHINAGGDYLYFCMNGSTGSTGLGFIRQTMGIYRSNKKGKQSHTISRNPAVTLLLVDNHLYGQVYDKAKGVVFQKLSLDGKKNEILSLDLINPSCCYDGTIYYNDNTKSHFLYTWDIASNTSEQVVKYNMWNPCRMGDYVYFMDIDNDYRLCRYSLPDDVLEVLSEDRVDCFNVTGEYVYFQKNSQTTPALKRVSLDGTREEVVAEGIFCDINATSRYVYFRSFQDNTVTYHTPINGEIRVNEFTAALDAAVSNSK